MAKLAFIFGTYTISAICILILIWFPTSSTILTIGLGMGRKYTTLERLKPEHLRAVREDRSRYQSSRRTISPVLGYQDYRAVMHVHAEDSSHTGGTLPELLAAAR